MNDFIKLLIEKNVRIFVIHALSGYDFHEKRVIDLMIKYNIPFEFMSEGDPSNFSKINLEEFFITNIQKNLNTGPLSCGLNHFLIYKKMLYENINYAMILEDDFVLLKNFFPRILEILNRLDELPKGFLLSLENTTLQFPGYFQTKKNKIFYRAKKGRMAAAYIIDYKAASNIIKDLKCNKCYLPIDHWHNDLSSRNIINIFWVHPPVIEQGSHNGMMYGTMSTKINSIQRRIRWNIQKFYKYYIRRVFNDNRIID